MEHSLKLGLGRKYMVESVDPCFSFPSLCKYLRSWKKRFLVGRVTHSHGLPKTGCGLSVLSRGPSQANRENVSRDFTPLEVIAAQLAPRYCRRRSIPPSPGGGERELDFISDVCTAGIVIGVALSRKG